MKKCKTCGRYFRLLAKNRYEVIGAPVGFCGETRYNAFDCPFCGCQNIYGEAIKKRLILEASKKTKEDAEA